MKIQLYMTNEDYENYCKGWEVTINNVPTINTSPRVVTQKIAVFIDEKEVIHLQSGKYVNEQGLHITHTVCTVKREKGPKASYL